jgi:Lon protease-like protein
MAATRRLPMFPLSSVLFPGAELPLHVFEPRYRELVADCLAGDDQFGVVLIARGSEVGGNDERFGVGTVAQIASASPLADGRWALLVVGTHRFAIERWLDDAPYPLAEVRALADDPGSGFEAHLERATAAVRRARTLLSELGSAAPVADLGDGTATEGEAGATEAETRLWRLCTLAPLTALDGQRLLEAVDHGDRLTLLTELCGALAEDLSLLLGGGPGAGRPPTNP